MHPTPDLDPEHVRRSTHLLVDTVRPLAAAGFAPATSGNFSVRLDASHFLITASGRDKRALGDGDVVVVALDGRVVETRAPEPAPTGRARPRPSAETPLHAQLYRRFPEAGAVLHTHSRHQTIASRLWADAGAVEITDWELLKAFAGHTTHEVTLVVPVFRNTQDMTVLVRAVDAYIDGHSIQCYVANVTDGTDGPLPFFGYLVEGHGLYTWGADLDDARRHLEALDFLLDCELELRRLRP